MGYQAEKQKIEGKIKRVKTVALCVTLAALLFLCVFSAFVPPDTWKYYVGKPRVSKRNDGEMRIHFLDVGQGDCTLVELPDGKVALIDGGDGREGTEISVLRYLNALDIHTIDHLIVSHADSDHCGSLDKVLKYKTVLNAYLPATEPENSNDEYVEFYARLLEEECAMQYSKSFTSLSGEECIFTFLYPHLTELADENDDNANSSVLWLDYKGVSALFTGDAPLATEGALTRDDTLGLYDAYGVALDSTEILKVAHHGSADSTGVSFLEYLNVQTSVISCGKNNLYGHPSDEVLYRLQQANVTAYCTDERGTVVITVTKDGKYTVECEK